MNIINLIALIVVPILAVSTKKKRQNSDIQNFNDEPNIRVDN